VGGGGEGVAVDGADGGGVGAVRQTVTMPALNAMPPQALVMPEQLFLAPVRGKEEGEIIDV